jgi:hypothetical protein
MQETMLEADYLVVGAGAMGMAFTDVLMTETTATVVMVDRYDAPGGHWTVAYPFVRLHQPSAFYGVNSRRLGDDGIDQVGWNKGLNELATAAEVCAYFQRVMEQQFLPSGRVRYFPMSEYLGDGRFVSNLGGPPCRVRARRVVDSTYMKVSVPSMRPPPYAVAAGARCVAPNALAGVREPFDRYVVVGAGKTGIDACLWLLYRGVDPARLTWIMPRDSWLLLRDYTQPARPTLESMLGRLAAQQEAIAAATSLDDLFARLEAREHLVRLDPAVRPTMWRCATVSRAELEQLRRIHDVVRLGRVRGIEADAIVLDGGRVPTSPRTLHVDCTADGLERRPAVPVFAGSAITLQTVRSCQQVFSAAFIAHVEATRSDEAEKNRLCTPVPHPDTDEDFVTNSLANSINAVEWAKHEELQAWLASARLNYYSRSFSQDNTTEAGRQAVMARLRDARLPAVESLQRLQAAIDARR